MAFIRPLRLAASLLVFIFTVWYLVHREELLQDAGRNWSSKFSWKVEPPRFDARLSPEKHARRHAKTLELDWVIRQELRSPDGVEKKVYTVNGPRYFSR